MQHHWGLWPGTACSQLSTQARQQQIEDNLLSFSIFSAFIFCTVSHFCIYLIQTLQTLEKATSQGEPMFPYHKHWLVVCDLSHCFITESAEACHGLIYRLDIWKAEAWFPFKHDTSWLLFCRCISLLMLKKKHKYQLLKKRHFHNYFWGM